MTVELTTWKSTDVRIESVTAQAFGPLSAESLQLAAGLTVIVGANESAKSTWHAAIYAGLCGRRRGRGAATQVDRQFAALHRPWDGDAWSVAVVLSLDDGRRIELSQDLAGKVDSRATDLGLARDVSNEIMNEGTPDGSKWLGLDRYSFLATACINQASVLEVLRSAEDLQDYLSRAAASATADVSAARALEFIEAFQKDQVGRLIANSVRPLKKATDSLERAMADRDAAHREHEEYLLLVIDAEFARQAAQHQTESLAIETNRGLAAEAFVSLTRTSLATREEEDRLDLRLVDSTIELEEQNRQRQRILELDSVFGGQPPAGSAEADEVSIRVATALTGWRSIPAITPLNGGSAESLRVELESLPGNPEGDTRPDPQVVEARAELATARDRLDVHDKRHPVGQPGATDDELTAAINAAPAVLRDLAGEIGAAQAMPSPTAREVASLAKQAADAGERARLARVDAGTVVSRPPSASHRRSQIAWVVAAVLGVSGVTAFAAGQAVGGAIAIALASAACGAGIALRRGEASKSPPEHPSVMAGDTWERVSDADRATIAAEEAHKTALAATAIAASVRNDLSARCAARGLPMDADRLRQLAAEVEVIRSQRIEAERWTNEQDEYSNSVASAEVRLREALRSRGDGVFDDQLPIDELANTYERACAARAEQTRAAARAPALRQRIVERDAVELLHAETIDRRQRAVESMVAVAKLVGVSAAEGVSSADDAALGFLASSLESWQRDRASQVRELDESRARWQELQSLLSGSSIDELSSRLVTATASRDELAVRVSTAKQLSMDAESNRISQATIAGVEPGQAPDLARAEAGLAVVRSGIESIRSVHQEAVAEAERVETRRAERASRVRSVAETEEMVACAQVELDRVNELARTLQETSRFLSQAQERVHRDIAPILVGTLNEWLPAVTDQRYVEAMVDPASLNVHVRGSGRPWRQADRLSVGTAEQVYLLLRMALAQHLAVTGETCPLLLDDVTVQADAARTIQILELLLAIAGTRQVVLFAQEPIVAEWAKDRLVGDKHAVIELAQVVAV